MGTVIQLPRVNFDDTVQPFDVVTMNAEQSAVYYAIRNGGITGYRTIRADGYTNNYYAVNNGDVFIAFYGITGTPTQYTKIGYLIRSDNPNKIGLIYDRSNASGTFGYDPFDYVGGITNYEITSEFGIIPLVDFFSNYQDAYDAISEAQTIYYPITYRLTNCTASSAPTEAAIGDTVNVPFVFPDGYGFPNPTTDVYVYNNGVLVPSSYANNVLTFTMPDPS